MKQRTLEEMISYFNQQVLKMDIKHEDKIKLLGMIIAIGYKVQKHEWIPCSERLPDEEVLCCDTRGEMIIGYPYPDEESNTGFSVESDDVFMIDCAAWMPLPKPYKAERRTDE